MDKALATQLANIEKRTGMSIAALGQIIKYSGLTSTARLVTCSSAISAWGTATRTPVVHVVLKSDGASAAKGKSADEVLDGIYTGPRAAMRPIHDRLMKAMETFGPFEVAPKKTCVSLRRKKRFATIGQATNTRFEVGLNMKGVKPTARLEALLPGGMCQYRVKVVDDVDAELMAWGPARLRFGWVANGIRLARNGRLGYGLPPRPRVTVTRVVTLPRCCAERRPGRPHGCTHRGSRFRPASRRRPQNAGASPPIDR